MIDLRRLMFLLVCGFSVLSESQAQDSAPGVLPPPSSRPSAPAERSWETLPPSEFESLLPPPVDDPTGSMLPDGACEECLLPPPPWWHPAFWFGPGPWEAGAELGINGSEGNRSVFSMRTGGFVKRKTNRWKYDSSLNYRKNQTNGNETQNNAKLDARLDRILAESPWTLFVLENLIYDELQAYDLQLSVNAGVGYQLIKTEATDLTSRFGAGSTREFGGVEDRWTPQALFGLDLSHSLTSMQRVMAKVDYFPEWEDFRRYRVVSDLSWEIDLDKPRNLSLKLSLIDRYDSTPNGAAANNFDYAVLMLWKL